MKKLIFAAMALFSLSGCCATVRTVPAYGGGYVAPGAYVQEPGVYYGAPVYRVEPRGYHNRGYIRVR
jgi:hypothetical protein